MDKGGSLNVDKKFLIIFSKNVDKGRGGPKYQNGVAKGQIITQSIFLLLLAQKSIIVQKL